MITTGVGGAWSLCVEISFYALLPVIGFGMARLARGRGPRDRVRLQLAVLAVLAVDCLAGRYALTGALTATVPSALLVPATSLPGLLDWFCIGMALAVLASDWEAGGEVLSGLRTLSARPGRCGLIAVSCYSVLIITHPGDLFLAEYSLLDHVALGATAGFLVLAAVGTMCSDREAAGLRVLRSRPMVWLGSVSYGIYLWNLAIVWALTGRTGMGHPQSAATVAGLLYAVSLLAVALGAASHYLIERPAQRWINRLIRVRPVVARAGA